MMSKGNTMGSKWLELKVMNCRYLKGFNFFQKLSVYAVVSIVSDDPASKPEREKKQQQQQKTATDRDGDGDPEWNEEMRFDLRDSGSDSDHLFLHFVLRCEGVLVLGRDRSVGEVRVPVKDLMEELDGIVRFASYEVRRSDGKPNGVLNFSYKVVNDEAEKIVDGRIDGYSIVQPPPSDVPQLYPSLDYLQTDCQDSDWSASHHQVHYRLQETYYPPPPPPSPPILYPNLVEHGPVHHPPLPWMYTYPYSRPF